MNPWPDAGESFLPAAMLLDQAEMGVIVPDRRVNLLYVNAFARQLLDVPAEAGSLIGQSLLAIGFDADQDKVTDLAGSVLPDQTWEGRFASPCSDGSCRLVQLYAVLSGHLSGVIDGILVFPWKAECG